jgi:uncharacterized membrane protein YphA (DoxX/SURF4 family)
MKKIIFWAIRFIPAIILLQTLFFKFTAAPESVYIFSKLGIEPVGRLGSGAVELLAGILLLLPRFSVWGALLSLGIMGGAILSHLTILGIDVQGDGGYLFALALATAFFSTLVVVSERQKFFDIIELLLPAIK